MLFTNLNLKPKTIKIMSLSMTLAGIIFILASEYIGALAVRIAMLILLIFCIVNIKMTYRYMTSKEKINYLVATAASIAGMIKTELTMLLIGAVILYFTVPTLFKTIKEKDYSDIVMIIINVTGVLFALFCILSAKAALNTVITIIGIILTVSGCLSLYEIIVKKHGNSSVSDIGDFDDTDDM